MMRPTWLDGVIQTEIDSGKTDSKKIAEAIASNPQFLEAIESGLAHKPHPGALGASYAQHVRTSIIDLLMK